MKFIGSMSRCDFLRSAGRAVIITGFAGFGFFLLKKDRVVQAENQKCISKASCSEFTEINTCTLPQALSARLEVTVAERYALE